MLADPAETNSNTHNVDLSNRVVESNVDTEYISKRGGIHYLLPSTV